MLKTAKLFAILTSTLAPLVAAPAEAQNLVTWVSKVSGNDVAGCGAPTTPCAQFRQAIGETVAGGEIKCLEGVDDIALVIDKPITIDCTGAPGLVYGFEGLVAVDINISEAAYPNAIVTLRGLTIDGQPQDGDGAGLDGIRFAGGGAALHVENCKIFGYNEQGIDFRPTSSVDLFVRDTVISNNLSGGVYVLPASAATVKGSLSNVRLDRNGGIGLYVVKTGGVAAAITVEGSEIEKNTFGIRANGASASILLNASTVAHNTVGLQVLSGGKIISFRNNAVRLNTTDGAPTSTVALK